MNLKRLFFNKQMIHSSFIAVIIVSMLVTGCDDSDDDVTGVEISFDDYSPTAGGKGTMLTLTGENFGTKVSDVKVWVNNNEVDVINVTQTQINGRVPVGAGSGVVKVKIGDREYTYPTPFEYRATYTVSTYAGNGEAGYVDGPVADAKFQNLHWLAYDSKEDIVYTLETDVAQQRIRRIKDGMIETVVNFRESQPINLNNPRSIEFSVTGDTLFIGNDNSNNSNNIHAVAITTRSDDFKVLKPYVTYPAAKTEHINFAGANPVDGTLVYYCYPGMVYAWDEEINQPILLAEIKNLLFDYRSSYGSLRFSPDGKTLYFISRNPYQGILSAEYDLQTKKLTKPFTRFAGTGDFGTKDGIGTAASMGEPSQGVFAKDGNLYMVERANHVVRRITPEGEVSTFIGTLGAGKDYVNGIGPDARFAQPLGFTIDIHNNMYVAEFENNRIRIITEEGE